MTSARCLLRICDAARLMGIAAVAVLTATQVSAQAGNSASSASAQPKPAPTAVMKVTTRMVSLEVVARDRQGRPVPGLTAKDFEVFEQIPPKKDRHPQTISAFREINWTQLRTSFPAPSVLPAGVYSNLVNARKVQVPPTVILFDAINTDLDAQLQVHRQMTEILKSIPPDVPVAIFLMADRMRLLQSFTTDPKLLREAASKTIVVNKIHPDQDPLDDPQNLSALLENVPSDHLPPGAIEALENFEQQTFGFDVGVRVTNTLEAFRGLSRYLNGFPGRKNVLWISTSFPLFLSPTDASSGDNFSSGLQAYLGDMQEVGNSLMEGKIAVYPVDAGGVRTQSMYEAGAIVRQPWSGERMGQSIQREDTIRQGQQQVMRDIADQTGGRPCIGDNDFADCVKKAVEDASSYYELAYYPERGSWQGEYHRIVLKTTRPGVHLRFREGYYAVAVDNPVAHPVSTTSEVEKDPALNRAACEDPLEATGLLLMVKAIPPDQPGRAKYFLAMDAHMVTFALGEAGSHELKLNVAACTFDKKGRPLRYFQNNYSGKLNEQQFAAASHGVTQTFELTPSPEVVRVRLLIRDSASGRIGSVDIPFSPVIASSASDSPAVKPLRVR